MLNEKVRAYLDSHRPEHLAMLKELLAMPSISAQPDHLADCVACAQWLADRFTETGLAARLDHCPGQPLVVAHSPRRPDRPTLLVYGHYDVQPPEPLDQWTSPPFEPTERGGDLVARGASDDKGPMLTWLIAARAWRQATGDWPVNLVFLIEGQEETGSPALETFIAGASDELACHRIAISDTTFHADGVPSITYGLRGLVYAQVTITGPAHDLHSGRYGGIVRNPLHVLAGLIAGLHDTSGRVTLAGFYDDVVAPSPAERAAWDRLGLDEAQLQREIGVDALAGEAGFSTLERLWARPCLDCNGLWGGYTGPGPKTVIPSWAKAKLSVRLVGHQRPQDVLAGLEAYFQSGCPAGTRADLEPLAADEPWLMSPDDPGLDLARAAMAEAFARPCALIRGGASVPVTSLFHRHLGVHPLMMGYGLPDDRIHSPNEKFRLDHFYRGAVASAALMQNLAEAT